MAEVGEVSWKVIVAIGIAIALGASALGTSLGAFTKAHSAATTVSTTTSQLSAIAPPQGARGERGPAGPAGPQGNQGPAGGTMQHQGNIQHVQTRLFVDRTDGTNPNSLVYLTPSHLYTSQYWTHNSNNTIQNKYGSGQQCLQGDPSGSGNVFMNNCDSSSLAQQWNWDSQGRLAWQQTVNGQPGTAQCLTVKKYKTLPSTPLVKNGRPSGTSGLKDSYKVELAACNNNEEQLWTFK